MLFQRVIARQSAASPYQGSTLVSVGLHVALLGVVGWHLSDAPVRIHNTIAEGILFLAPPPTPSAGPGAQNERLTFSHLDGLSGTGQLSGTDVGSMARPVERGAGQRAGEEQAGQRGEDSRELASIFTHRADSIYLSSQVDNPAAFDERSGAPIYPDSLRIAGVEGSVTAQFVVDTTGRVDVASFVLLESTHGRFTQSVREALPRMLFRPAELNGQKIKQLVQLPFKFKLQPANAFTPAVDTSLRLVRRPQS